MIVKELRAILAAVPDELEVVVRAWDDENSVCSGVSSARVTLGCDEELFFAIDACEPGDERERPEDSLRRLRIALASAIDIGRMRPMWNSERMNFEQILEETNR